MKSFRWRALLGQKPQKNVFIGGLVLAFLVSFTIPLLIVGQCSGIFETVNLRERLGLEARDETFPDSLLISSAASFLRVSGSDYLDPPDDKDFLLISWFKLREMPLPGERVVLLSKHDERSRVRRGYALGLQGEKDAVRPMIYWRSSGGEGGWKLFPEIKLKPRSWFMLALSYYQDRYLGLHLIDYADSKHPQLSMLGGYDMQDVPRPRSSSDLIIGSFGASELRGKIGPLGIFNIRNLQEDLKNILSEFSSAPLNIPSRFDHANIMFWMIDSKNDLGKAHHKIEYGSGEKPKRENKE